MYIKYTKIEKYIEILTGLKILSIMNKTNYLLQCSACIIQYVIIYCCFTYYLHMMHVKINFCVSIDA